MSRYREHKAMNGEGTALGYNGVPYSKYINEQRFWREKMEEVQIKWRKEGEEIQRQNEERQRQRQKKDEKKRRQYEEETETMAGK